MRYAYATLRICLEVLTGDLTVYRVGRISREFTKGVIRTGVRA